MPVLLPFISGDEVWVLRNGCLRTVSGWEQSSTKQNFPCAARVPGGVNCKGNGYGFRFEACRTVFEKENSLSGEARKNMGVRRKRISPGVF